MTASPFADPPPPAFWPEPLIIELVADRLDQYRVGPRHRTEMARRHARTLRSMVDDGLGWRVARAGLDETYAALGLTPHNVAAIDCAVFSELTRLIGDRHRTSARRRYAAAVALRAALDRLPAAIRSPQAGRADHDRAREARISD